MIAAIRPAESESEAECDPTPGGEASGGKRGGGSIGG